MQEFQMRLTLIKISYLRSKKCTLNNFIQFNEQLFLEGYSEGGYVTMAAVKEIEENLSHEFNITMSFPMAGAYDLSGVLVDLMLSEEVYPDPYYLDSHNRFKGRFSRSFLNNYLQLPIVDIWL